jgi:hypothetical protein
MRHWIEGARLPPAVVIERLAVLARALDQVADQMVSAINEEESEQAVLLVYRRDDDVPTWTGLRTAGCHLALVRRVVERRPDVQLVSSSSYMVAAAGLSVPHLGSGVAKLTTRSADPLARSSHFRRHCRLNLNRYVNTSTRCSRRWMHCLPSQLLAARTGSVAHRHRTCPFREADCQRNQAKVLAQRSH